MLWLCLCLSYFLVARSDEMFAADSGAVYSAHCSTRGQVSFYAGSTQLQHIRRRQDGRVEVRFKGHKDDQEPMGSVRVRRRPRFAVRSNLVRETAVPSPLRWR